MHRISSFVCKITKNSLTLHIKQRKFTHNKLKSKSKLYYPFSIAIAVVIWIVCMIPVPETPLDNVRFIDKWTHFAMYGTLTTAIWVEYILRHRGEVAWGRLLAGGMLAPVLMGGAVELAQAYLTTCRSGEWLDALCNSLGVLLGAGIGRTFLYVRQR